MGNKHSNTDNVAPEYNSHTFIKRVLLCDFVLEVSVSCVLRVKHSENPCGSSVGSEVVKAVVQRNTKHIYV